MIFQRAFLESRAGVTRVIEASRLKFFELGLCSSASMEYAKSIIKRIIETGWVVRHPICFLLTILFSQLSVFYVHRDLRRVASHKFPGPRPPERG